MPRPTEDPGDGAFEPGGLSVTVVDEGPVRVVTVVGELDHDTADGLRAALAEPLLDGLDRILVDLDGLRFCDSTGLNILLRARLDADAAGWTLELAAPRPAVARLFAITGADSVLRIHPDRATALGPEKPTDPGEWPGPSAGQQ
ncbi:STAS domain-containing protein [Streptomyces sp. Y1]|uniref:Anti-sigma factor antagonist n=1 Tax=Streptomyces sp. Y1 TaxID=3238634 RepID=A0AB39TUX2_9ACTN